MAKNSVDECTKLKVCEVLEGFTLKGALSFMTDETLLEMCEEIDSPDYRAHVIELVKDELSERHIYV